MSNKPNILFLLNDHQTYYGHGEMSGGPKIQRPNFERLAREGIEFSHAYTACPLCGPARRTLLTGLFPHNHRELKNEVNYPFDKETYLNILANAGYKNYYFGKWHAGPGTAHEHQCDGFSYPGYNNPLITSEYRAYLKKKNLPVFKAKIVRSFWDLEWKIPKDYDLEIGKEYTPLSPNYEEGVFGIMTTPKETHEAFFLAHLACEKLRDLAESNSEKPFHLRVDFWGPHPPYFVTQDFLDLYNPEDIPIYPNLDSDLINKPNIYKYDIYYPISKNGKLIYPNPLPWPEWQKVLAISYAHNTLIDHAGGLILNTLEKLGLNDNTLVIWTLDHGDGLACHGGHFDKYSYMPEEMIRIPLAISYPDIIPSGQISEHLVSNIDIAPTILDVAGLSFKSEVDGKSLLPICSEKSIKWREDLMCETHGHHAQTHIGRAILTNRYKYVFNHKDMDELYDLKNDPYELNNLIYEDEFDGLLDDMKRRLTHWRAETNDIIDRQILRKILSGKIR